MMTVGELVAYLDLNDTAFNAKLAGAQSRFTTAGRSMTHAGASMMKSMTMPILAIGGASLVMAAKFQTAMRLIQTQAGGSAADVKFL